MVADMRSITRLFIVGLYRLYSKESKTSILVGVMDITSLLIHVQEVKEDKSKG